MCSADGQGRCFSLKMGSHQIPTGCLLLLHVGGSLDECSGSRLVPSRMTHNLNPTPSLHFLLEKLIPALLYATQGCC